MQQQQPNGISDLGTMLVLLHGVRVLFCSFRLPGTPTHMHMCVCGAVRYLSCVSAQAFDIYKRSPGYFILVALCVAYFL